MRRRRKNLRRRRINLRRRRKTQKPLNHSGLRGLIVVFSLDSIYLNTFDT